MSLVARLPNAPQNYDAQNEAQFRNVMRQALTDATSPVILQGGIAQTFEGTLGDTLVHDGAGFVATKNFSAEMFFEDGFALYDLAQAQAQNSWEQIAVKEPQASGTVIDTGTYKYAWTDFSEYGTSVGAPAGITWIGGVGVLSGISDLGGTEGKVMYHAYGGGAYAWSIDNWEDTVPGGIGEMFQRMYIDTPSASGFRVKGIMGFGYSTAGAFTNGIGVIVYTFLGTIRAVICQMGTGGGIAPTTINYGQTHAGTGPGWVWLRFRTHSESAGIYNCSFHMDEQIATDKDDPPGVPLVWDVEEEDATTAISSPSSCTTPFIRRTTVGPIQFSQNGTSILSFSGDTTYTQAAPGSAPADAGSAKHVIQRNIFASDTKYYIKPNYGALGSTDNVGALAIVRDADALGAASEGLELYSKEAAGSSSAGLKMTKVGSGSYHPFYFGWDDTVGLTVLSPDDVGGPLWTFADDVAISGTLDVTGVTTFAGGIALSDDADLSLGTGTDYYLRYALADTALQFWSANVDGVPNPGKLFEVQDGTDDIVFTGEVASTAGFNGTVGAGTPAAGTFTTVDINGGTIDGTTIGATTASSGAFSTLDVNNGVALGAGGAATLGLTGASGPTTAAQSQWLQVSIGGVNHWIAVWV